MESNFRALQNENYQLREYILNLQSRLLESQSEIPPAPSHISFPSGGHPSAGNNGAADSSNANAVEQQLRREMQNQGSSQPTHDGMSQLQAAAAQASEATRPQESPYGLGGDYPPSKRARAGEDAPPGSRDGKPSS